MHMYICLSNYLFFVAWKIKGEIENEIEMESHLGL